MESPHPIGYLHTCRYAYSNNAGEGFFPTKRCPVKFPRLTRMIDWPTSVCFRADKSAGNYMYSWIARCEPLQIPSIEK